MTSNIRIDYNVVKPTSVSWKCGVSNFSDTCVITLPLSTHVKTVGKTTETGDSVKKVVFDEGMPVEVSVGYDGENTLRFVGFVSRVNYAIPLTLECEGFSWQLRQKRFTKSYKATTVKDILKDLVAGTDIKLSKYIPDIPLKDVWFKDSPGVKVLEWFQKECLCTVFFDFNTIYVGASRFGVEKWARKLRLGWNTANDDELKKSTTATPTQINIVDKNSTGTVKRTKSAMRKYDTTKDVRARAGLPSEYLKKVAAEMQASEDYQGYQGCVTCFLVPSFEKGMVADITDRRFPDRTGKYFVEAIEGNYSSSGGRQKLTLRNYGK